MQYKEELGSEDYNDMGEGIDHICFKSENIPQIKFQKKYIKIFQK